MLREQFAETRGKQLTKKRQHKTCQQNCLIYDKYSSIEKNWLMFS